MKNSKIYFIIIFAIIFLKGCASVDQEFVSNLDPYRSYTSINK